MPKYQPKFLTRLKSTGDAKRDALDAEQKSLVVEREKRAKLVKDSTDKNRQFFAIYLGLWAYVLLMVFATTDQMLLVPTQGIKLPLADIYIPLLSFYWFAPLFLLVIHLNLLQNLESHHYKLIRWRGACGGAVPRQEISAFLFDYAWLERGSKMDNWVRLGYRSLFLHSGPLALGILLWRFTDYQDIVITFWHLIAFAIDSYLVWLTGTAFMQNMEPDKPQPDPSILTGRITRLQMFAVSLIRSLRNLAEFLFYLLKTFWRRAFGMMVLLQFGLACWFHFSSDGFLDGWNRINGRIHTQSDLLANFAGEMKQAVPSLHSLLLPIISIDPNETAWIPDKNEVETQAMLAGEEKAAQWWQAHGVGLNLTDRHLRGFSAPYAHLPKLKLGINADLQGANLHGARLQEAYFARAQLQEVDLSEAQLQGANLADAQLQGANLGNAQLEGTHLYYTNFQGAHMDGANFQGAFLMWASMQGASLRHAQFQGGELSRTMMQGAILSETNFQGTRLPDRVSYPKWLYPVSDAEYQGAQYQPDVAVTYYKQPFSKKPQNNFKLMQALHHQPEAVWEQVIPAWDKDERMPLENLLAAARGLRKNYGLNEAMHHSKEDSVAIKYQYEINLAFCSSERLKILCLSEFNVSFYSEASSFFSSF